MFAGRLHANRDEEHAKITKRPASFHGISSVMCYDINAQSNFPVSFTPPAMSAPLFRSRLKFIHARVGLAALVLLVPFALAAQPPRARLVADFERMRVNVLAMIDSMPAKGLRTAPSPGVRDFAEQIEHVAIGNVNLIASGVDADRITLGMDKNVYLNDKAELKKFVNVAFDRVRAMLTAMSDQDLVAQGRLFGQIPAQKWQIVQAAYEHGLWTLGQTVPYVRTQGGTPHSFNIVPSRDS